MTLTPLDIEKLELRKAWRGYAREDVERFRYEALHAVEEYLARINTLQTRVAELERDLQQYRANEELLKSSVVLAQKTSDELIVAARQRAELIIREAEAEGEEIRRRLTDARNEREQFEYAFHGLLSGFIHRLEQGNPALKPATHTTPSALPERDSEQSRTNDGDITNQMAGDGLDSVSAKTDEPVQSDYKDSEKYSFTDGRDDIKVNAPAPAMPLRSVASAPIEPRVSQPATVSPAPSNERDADIGDFTAVLASAPSQPSPPRVNAIEHGRLYSVTEPAAAGSEPTPELEPDVTSEQDEPQKPPEPNSTPYKRDPLAPASDMPLSGEEE